MLVTFTTDDCGNIILFGDIALARLGRMGHTPTVRGEPAVSLSNRALPLINLLEAAAKSNSRVMWK